jgi:cytochrome b pre-mRNA-processing protein 3
MILNLFRRTPRTDSFAALYGAIVAQARQPGFYQSYGVADTAAGRLEMIMLHAVLVLSRLDLEGVAVRRQGQALFDQFCSDMDANLREMGVGDMAVPRRMKNIGEAFYGRKRAYEQALASPDTAELAQALGRNVYADAPGAAIDAERLAAYAREAVGALATCEIETLLHGRVAFPDPNAVVIAADTPGAP